MNYKMVGKLLSRILMVEAVFMIPSVGIGIYDRDYRTVSSFLLSIGIILAIAAILSLLCRHSVRKGFYAREGMVCVSISWIVISLLGCLPFTISGAIPNYIDALFEIVSGFTTTGASIIPEVERLSRGILYWRSFSHWLGGNVIDSKNI